MSSSTPRKLRQICGSTLAICLLFGGGFRILEASAAEPLPLLPRQLVRADQQPVGESRAIDERIIVGKADSVSAPAPGQRGIHGETAVPKALFAAMKAFERKNYALAKVLFTDSNRIEHPISQYHLGLMLEYGLGVDSDLSQAAAKYRSAAESRHASAAYNLGLMYADGRGVALSQTEAAKWIRLAAESGLPAAQHALAMMFFNGTGLEKDLVQAMKWFELAAAGGSRAAQGSRNSLERILKREELIQARQLASLWRPQPS